MYSEFVHQLDFSTSGALCLALNKDACSRASKLFSSRSVLKEYVALVRGRVEADFMTIEKAVAQSTEPGYEHMMCIPTEDSTQHVRERPAVTNLQVISRGHYNGEPSTKVLLTPQTGRRHQLRVHCSHIGHTIVGDFTYSLRKDIKPYRMMLHALRLVIPLPNEHIDITAPDPFIPDIDPAWKPEESS
ncbi:RNA pseudouridylate synthase domain-containing protein 1-like isoform X2 [Ptychodera flava]|uniref:RNA pseudouridylate synthase domain-containing protein 1-like isoform X2 n=1 Tax=Ptychodera flava TaxID=63121 RepID=UPI00396A07F2